MTTRFLAEWCSSDGPQDGVYFDPDLCVYETKAFEDQRSASSHAEAKAKPGPADDWYKVSEQVYVPYIYHGTDIGQWETVATWMSGEYVEEST